MVVVPAEIRNIQNNKKSNILFPKTSFTFLKDCSSNATNFFFIPLKRKGKNKSKQHADGGYGKDHVGIERIN